MSSNAPDPKHSVDSQTQRKTFLVACPCGQQLQVMCVAQVQKVRCPRCSRLLTVAASTPSPAPTSPNALEETRTGPPSAPAGFPIAQTLPPPARPAAPPSSSSSAGAKSLAKTLEPPVLGASAPTLEPPSPRSTGQPAHFPTHPDAADLSPEEFLPGFEVFGELGQGGMGVVYKARDSLSRTVALKMIRSGATAGSEQRKRFRDEAEAVAKLQHPNIVQVFAFGEHAGEPYFSLEFCAGGSLEKKLRERPLRPKQAAKLVEVLARAMQHAHEHDLLHRDLKPANVLLAEDGTPKITDFGLAKKLDDESGQTKSGMIMGTPSYMAPEQACGKVKELGPACDVWALGAILYECLTGQPPFRAATVMDTLMQVMNEEPQPPMRLARQTPRDLETICLKCLQKEPRKRYLSALNLAEDLKRFQAGEPITARPMGRMGRGLRWCKRNPSIATLLVLVFVLLVAGITVSTLFAMTARDNAKEAEGLTEARQLALQQVKNEKEKVQKELTNAQFAAYALRLRDAQIEIQRGRFQNAETLLQLCDQKFRSWEHDYLLRQTQRLMWTKEKSAESEAWSCMAFSLDGERIVLGSENGTMKVWKVRTGEATLSLKGHKDWVKSVTFSANGKQIVSQGAGTVKVWDALTGQQVRSLDITEGQCVAVSPDAKFIVSGWENPEGEKGDRGEVKVLNMETGKETFSRKRNECVRLVAISSDGKLIVTWEEGDIRDMPGEVNVWNAENGKELLSIKGQAVNVTSLAFSPDGKRIIWGEGKFRKAGTVKVRDATTGEEVFSLRGHRHKVSSVACSRDGKRIISGGGFDGKTGDVMVWSARTGQLVSSLQGHTDTVRSVASSPDGRCVLSLDKRGTIKAWDTRYDPGALTIKGHTEKVQKVAFSLDGSRIVSRSDRITRIWDPLDGRPASRPESDFPSDRDGTEWFSPDSKRIVSGDSEGVITIRDASSKQEILTLRGHTGRIRTVAFSPDGKRIASGSADKSVKVWDAETGQMLFSLTGHFHEVLSVAFSPDGTRLISGDGKPEGENKLAVDLQQMTQEEQDELFYGPVKEETPGEIKVWDMETGQEALSLRSHTDSVLSLAFSPDGKRIVSGSADCSVKVWSAEVQAVSTAEKP